MIHLSSLLLHFQYGYLFIISLSSFLQIYLFFIIISYLLSIYILSSQCRSSVVNVVLIINDSLIFFAPSSPIPLSVHCILLITRCTYYYIFLIILLNKSNDAHGVMGNTFSMYFISSSVLTFHFIIISLSLFNIKSILFSFDLQTPHPHISTPSSPFFM